MKSIEIWYIANVRFPSEKAYSIAIHRMCEAFVANACAVTLIVPGRHTDWVDLVYTNPMYSIKRLPTLDLFRHGFAGKAAFFLQAITFNFSLFAIALTQPRNKIVYTRDPVAILLRYLGYRVYFEFHITSPNKLFNFLAERATMVIAVSKSIQDKLLAAGVEKNNCIIARSGVDLEIFDIDVSLQDARRKLNLPLDRKIALYTGKFTTMNQDKGLSDCISAMKELPDVLFVAVGGTDSEITLYQKEALQAGVVNNVMLRQHTSQQNLALYQKAADILLMPFPDTPQYRSNMSPIKMFEYMASKRPIVATNLPTIQEVLSDSTAILVPPDSPQELALGIKRVIQNPKLGEEIANNAYGLIKKYSWSARAVKIIQRLITLNS